MAMNWILIAFLTLAGIPVTLSATSVEMTPGNAWSAEAGGWMIDYAGTGWAMLPGRIAVSPDAFYRISWRKDALSGPNSAVPIMELNTLRPQRVDCTENRGTHCWYSGTESELKFRFYFNPGKTGKVRISEVKVEEIPPESLTENLLPNGDWENGNLSDFWQPGWGIREWYASIVPSPDFLNGEKSLHLSSAPEKRRYAVISGYMPAVPGSTVELRFWAKADREASLVANIDCQSPAKQTGTHLYKLQAFRLDTDWREYVLRFKLPTDRTVYPALADCAARIHFGRETGIDGDIWIDNVEFRQVSPP